MMVPFAVNGRALLLGLTVTGGLMASTTLAVSQSSNSSSNCSNGRCTLVETYQDRGRGWRRVERWDERATRSQRYDRRDRRGEGRYGSRRGGRDDDDDD